MSKDSGDSQLLSDSALEKPEDDQLGYDEFAKDIADLITTEVPGEEFIIGIYGPWGSGKSTALNFIEYYLNQRQQPPAVIRFNPWWFSGQEDLIERFFAQLESGLEHEDGFDKVRAQLSNFSSALSNIPLSAVTGVPSQRVLQFISQKLDPTPGNVEELKQEISSTLEEADRRIVVFLDDIDRLAEDEMAQMFRLVKSVADFPNITYILAFDHDVVTSALEREQVVQDGEEYLDKIIQLPQHLPIPEEGSLDQFFIDRINQIIGDRELEINEHHWQRVYGDGVLPTLKTPRDAVRLSNSVRSSYRRLGDEVNFIDLVAIETLRIFYTDAYEYIREHPEEFVNNGNPNRLRDEDDYSEFFNEHTPEGQREWVEEILTYLFPRIDSGSFMGSRYSEDSSTFRKRKRICHPEVFPFYFRQTVPQGELTTNQVESVLSVAENPEEFAEELKQLSTQEGKDGRSKANRFLNRLSDYINEFSAAQTENVVKALFLVGDELCVVDPSSSILDGGTRNQISPIVREAVETIDNRSERLSLLKQSIQEGNSPYISCLILGVLYQEHGELGGNGVREEERLLDYDQLEEFRSVVVEKIEEIGEEGGLLESPNLDIILTDWMEWGDSAKVVEWVEQNTQEADDLLRFLNHYVSEGRYASVAESGVRRYFDPQRMEPFFELSELEDRLDGLDQEELDEREQRTVELFKEGKEMLDNGINTSDFSAWRTKR